MIAQSSGALLSSILPFQGKRQEEQNDATENKDRLGIDSFLCKNGTIGKV